MYVTVCESQQQQSSATTHVFFKAPTSRPTQLAPNFVKSFVWLYSTTVVAPIQTPCNALRPGRVAIRLVSSFASSSAVVCLRCLVPIAFLRSPSPRTPRRNLAEVSQMGAEAGKKGGVIALFDVDGTLTPARKEASAEMLQFLQELRKVITVGVVGGSDLVKISEQLGKNTTSDYDYVFSENGLVAYKQGKLIGNQSLKSHLGDEKLKKLINFILHYVADLDIPIKRGTFIEFRMGMLNVSPIGRNCSYEEREEFEKYDSVHNIRSKFVEILKEKFADYSLTYSIGGQISFDVFPLGWDKTFCLSFIEKEFSEIHFFGDKTFKGGNDYEIFESEKTIGHTVTSPEDTRSQCTKLFL